MKRIGIFYGSTTGNTAGLAKEIQKHFQDATLIDIATLTQLDFSPYDVIFLGSSTWGLGELQDDWIKFENKLGDQSLSGKFVTFFGTGSQDSYPDTFADALGILQEKLIKSEAKFIGQIEIPFKNYTQSKAIHAGQFIGLIVDDSHPGVEIKDWCELIKSQI